MLDLDSLAEKCARSLNEQQEKWLDVVWSAAFQRVSKNMSDGEVEIMLRSCRSVKNLNSLLHFLKSQTIAESPFLLIENEAQKVGLTLTDWISSLPTQEIHSI